jgi:uncharacterized protein YdaT
MPWTASDATRHTKRANTAKKRRQFAHVANSMLNRGSSEGAAIRAANAVVKRGSRRSRRRSRRA